MYHLRLGSFVSYVICVHVDEVLLISILIFYLSVVNGMYGTWSLWSECDRTCGGGARVRSRSCTNPPAQFGGSDCSSIGPDRETELCNLNSCPGKKVVWR